MIEASAGTYPKWLARMDCGHNLNRTLSIQKIPPEPGETRLCFFCHKDGKTALVVDVVINEDQCDKWGRT